MSSWYDFPACPKTIQIWFTNRIWKDGMVASKADNSKLDAAIAAIAFDLQATIDGVEPDLTSAIVVAVAKAVLNTTPKMMSS